ncbi:MAG: MBL fold metallo-hydrolase [Roseburia sp.]|nr:MBL fold metallo-hydrolase [Ruminococcus sp.]MCM1156138.1 MBL fold metallo-hydrolase [Roseburia sp.]MCM1243453.1 MBL fold metallo-hydrolase [Roseburia sp.]
MKIIILGSGGCVSTPRPCCNCPVCTEARQKGFPYARTGCSLFIEDINVLIDTPEDISTALNNAHVQKIEHILYSHCDPDHTMGMRVIEQLKMDWLAASVGKTSIDPIEVASLPVILDDIRQQGTAYGSALSYYEAKGLIYTSGIRTLEKKNILIELIPVDTQEHVTVFVISSNDKKIIYAPCDVKPFPASEKFQDADVLIIGNTIVGNVLKSGFVLNEDNPLRKELFTLEEVDNLRKQYEIKEVIITHLEEDWGKSYDDYKKWENSMQAIRFAYDGLAVQI